MIITSIMNELTKKMSFIIKLFVAADKLNTLKLLNKITKSPKQIRVLRCIVNFEQFSHIDITLSSNILFLK